MKRIRIQKPRARRERPWSEALPPDPRDPDIVRAKALARGRPSPDDVRTMHPYMWEELARPRERELRRRAERYARVRSGRRRPESARQRTDRALARIDLALARGSGDA